MPIPFAGRLLSIALFAIALAVPAAARAQLTSPDTAHWTWSDLRSQPAVDTSQLRWLEDNVPIDEAHALLSRIGQLSQPAAIQMLPSLSYLEGNQSSRSLRLLADSLAIRPAAGWAGQVRIAYFLARSRKVILDNASGSTYQPRFSGTPFSLPAPPSAKPQPGAAVALSLDFAPAETLLAIIGTPDIPYHDALARISTPAFDALVIHHGQSFYDITLTREQLALNLVHASSTQPLDELYRYARPGGFYHFADVRENADRYRALFATLAAHREDIARYLNASLSPYLPAGTRIDRRVSFYFDDLSDGWGYNDIAAVPLEYYKDDFARMFNTMVHETFHAAQAAVRRTSTPPARRLPTEADSAIAQAFSYVLGEGTANYLAPTLARSAASADSMSRAGAAILAELVAMRGGDWNAARAQELLNRGVAGGGPFYWLGAAMARELVARDGPAAIGRLLQSDGLAFAQAYISRVRPALLLSEPVREAVRQLAVTP
ncbi:MAG: hypothetical protein JWO05_3678 [Gemmatimonadetes bacterium]|nr:hypothetical protein [Gemmatimonadota bacterium]